MSIISGSFWGLVLLSVMMYYIVPVRFRWGVLFGASLIFWFYGNGWKAAFIMLIMLVITYCTGIIIEKNREKIRFTKLILICDIVINVGMLITLKDIRFFLNIGNYIIDMKALDYVVDSLTLLAPVGISYFTLTLIGYVLDVYWGKDTAESNPLKFGLFAGYFPLLTSGPIIRSVETKNNILEGHKFYSENFCFGLQRILWGLFKKLILSEKLALVVNAVYSDYDKFAGFYVWIAILAFTIQLYADFSGCIDIIMGISELFGITLPENFDMPFISRSLSEVWRRWHITLGGWLRDYILYPILKSELWQKMGKITKKRFGKKVGKKIPVWLGMLISWFLIGFWHGGMWKYIWGVGLYYGFAIILGEMLEPVFQKLISGFRINTGCFSWKAFQVVRTFILFAVGLSFFRASGMSDALNLWKAAFVWNPEILVYEPLTQLGISSSNLIILMLSLLIMIVSGVLRYYMKRPLREWLAEQNIVFRWGILYILIFCIVIYGYCEIGYDSSAFIYAQF